MMATYVAMRSFAVLRASWLMPEDLLTYNSVLNTLRLSQCWQISLSTLEKMTSVAFVLHGSLQPPAVRESD